MVSLACGERGLSFLLMRVISSPYGEAGSFLSLKNLVSSPCGGRLTFFACEAKEVTRLPQGAKPPKRKITTPNCPRRTAQSRVSNGVSRGCLQPLPSPRRCATRSRLARFRLDGTGTHSRVARRVTFRYVSISIGSRDAPWQRQRALPLIAVAQKVPASNHLTYCLSVLIL